MIIDRTVSKAIDDNLVAEEKQRDAQHKSSGKLSAGKLGWPLQWQILDHMKIEPVAFDNYTLRKFLRGRQVEDWLVTQIPGIIEKQKFVKYRNVVGYVDAYVDASFYEFSQGRMVHEVKSVTNAKYKMITKRSQPDESHCLQACLYAMALDTEYFAIDYVASDDYRVTTYIQKTDDWSPEVNKIITEYDEQLLKKEVPVFVPLYQWQKNKMYNSYPEWTDLTQQEINEKVERLAKENPLS